MPSLEVRAAADWDTPVYTEISGWFAGRFKGKIFRYDTAPGASSAEYHGDVKVGKRLTGVVLKGGETTRATIDFGDVLGTLRIRVLAGDEDVTREAAVEVAGEDVKLQPALRGNYREVLVRPGVYGVKGSYRCTPAG